MRELLWIAPALVLASTSVGGPGHATEEITFFKVLDSETVIPGEESSFGRFHLSQDSPGYQRRFASPRIAMSDDGGLAFGARDGEVDRVFAIIDGEVYQTPLQGDLGQISIDGEVVRFGVLGGSAVGGLFQWEPGSAPVEIAGARTLVPGGRGCVFWTGENGVSNRPFSVDGESILFSGRGTGELGSDSCGDLEGTFLWWQGSIQQVGKDKLLGIDPLGVAVDAGLVAFAVDGAIYTQGRGDSSSTRIVGSGDPIPGRSAVFSSVDWPEVVRGRVAFRGLDEAGKAGVYLWEVGEVSVLVEEGFELPGHRNLERLSGSHPLRLGEDRVAVFGSDGQGPLLYLASLEGGWERVIDVLEIASTGERMGEFDGRQLLLVGQGTYVVRPDGSLLKLLRSGELLDGQLVRRIYPGALRGNHVAFGIEFSGSFSDHLYVAELPPISVAIDVKPERSTNRIQTRSRRSVLVAILGSEVFDAEDVVTASVGLGPDAAPVRGRARLRDVNRDGWRDLVLRFRPRDTGIASGETKLCLSGETDDGVKFEGCDEVNSRHRARATRSD